MSFDKERLYTLLPALYRIRDLDQGGPLKALLSVIAEQVAVLEEDLDQLYDDQFIETCAEWVVPYIGDLIGARGLFTFPGATFSQRAQVANTIRYRRRKGTAAVLEQLARDVTSWDASVVEYFQLLATTQYMNHPRPGNISVMDLRDWESLEYLHTPFNSAAHTVDVRRIETRRGRYNIPHIGIFLWRIRSHPLRNAPAFKVDSRRYLLNPLGKNTQLYNRPEPEEHITHLAEPINVPMPLSRRILDHYLETYYGPKKSLALIVDGADIEASQIIVCNLEDRNGAWAYQPKNAYAIDPALGRIALPTNSPVPKSVQVSFHFGFSDEIGGGEYGRVDTFDSKLQPVVRVPSDKATIQEALDQLAASGGVVEIENNEYYVETPIIRVSAGIPEGKKIELRAADEQRPVLVLSGDLLIVGGENAEVTLNGLVMSGGLIRVPLKTENNTINKLHQLRLQHCTLLPGPSPAIKGVPAQPATPKLFVESSDTVIEIEQCIVGGLRIIDEAQVRIINSIIDITSETEVAYAGLFDGQAGAPMEVKNSTIIGKVHTVIMESASNTIFLASLKEFDAWPAPVLVERLQKGCLRFSYIPPNSQVPRQYKCQPTGKDEAARIRPVFTSQRYGDAGYCQLSRHCAIEIKQGADDKAEMGAFHNQYQPQREINLRTRLNEYLRYSLEAGIFYAT